ncbi:MAG: UDP-N-acetylglucosamine 2-epimerase (non-hydrolyzing) [Flavobacteriales bacterium]|nr:UDP-N-acetylglucosamine 2-epimerase (non-hydrolyzing) [Flavobacteriales bacterium]
MKKKILISVGTRPNFIKVTRFKECARNHPNLEIRIVHTGQHYDRLMSSVFFEQFGLQPDYYLTLESRLPSMQMGEITMKIGELLDAWKPDLLVVPGDVNSTLAAALAANKAGVPLAHLESGLRSHDRTMPEEINRILTDEITETYFITEQSGMDNLLLEGTRREQLHFVGNTMIDTLVAFESEIEQSTILEDLGIRQMPYLLMTMHRPSNVDNEAGLIFIRDLLQGATTDFNVVFPMHPRTWKKIDEFNLRSDFEALSRLTITDPLDYFAFQKLIKHTRMILTDSGGIQEESTFRQVPCLTIRDNTERPVTCELGTNELVPRDARTVLSKMTTNMTKKGIIPPLWDGKATERILEIIAA